MFEASGRAFGDKARIQSAALSLMEDHCLHFYYHMYGADMGTLRVRATQGAYICLASHGCSLTHIYSVTVCSRFARSCNLP